ncbi:MAG: helix-turn-helix transcriptional regulator [Oscillospiraceae bacterium]|nr:helix-turn-helix transcriptional regulator [Oscillospiraceae bacterium]
MNKDFPRILKLLRKERGLRQKEAADKLGVAQALLSHYENGKRECGLDFLVQAADFYNVSVDYILGRSNSRNGAVVTENELEDSTVSDGASEDAASTGILLRKKLVTNALEIVFSLLIKTKNQKLSKSVGSYMLTAVYRAFRMVYSAGGENDENLFSIPRESLSGITLARLSLDDVAANTAEKEGTVDEKITNSRIEQEYPKQSTALFSVINNVEKELKKL